MSLSVRLGPAEAAALCDRAALAITDTIQKEGRPVDSPDWKVKQANDQAWQARDLLLKALANLAVRLDPATSGRLARLALGFIEGEGKAYFRSSFVPVLEAMTSRLTPAEAGALRSQAARSIARVLESKDEQRLGAVEALMSLSAKLDPAEASGICGRLARSIAQAIDREPNGHQRGLLAVDLPTISAGLGPADAAIVARSVARAINPQYQGDVRSPLVAPDWDASGTDINRQDESDARARLAKALTSLTNRLEPSDAATIARSIAGTFGRSTDPGARTDLARCLVALASRSGSLAMIQKLAALACSGPMDLMEPETLTALLSSPPGTANLSQKIETHGSLLTTQELVDLLKMPTCIGAIRRVVLDQLGLIHGRRFANHWDFVRFAEEKGLKLDFTSPPRRSDSKL